MTKIQPSAAAALERAVFDGMTLAVGGFGLSGVPTDLITALRDTGVRDLTVASNNLGIDGQGLGLLLEAGMIRKVQASYVGENRLFAELYLKGGLDVEFVPQGTLAERLRAGGAGIPAFYTATGVGTLVAEGKLEMEFDGTRAILERGIVADLSLVRAHRGDAAGNLRYRLAARNFNPLVATAGRITIAEVEELLDDYLEPDDVHTPGVFVQHIVAVENAEKHIEQRTVRQRIPGVA